MEEEPEIPEEVVSDEYEEDEESVEEIAEKEEIKAPTMGDKDKSFRDFYVAEVTDSFAEEWDALRKVIQLKQKLLNIIEGRKRL
jgi:hypothetical protein